MSVATEATAVVAAATVVAEVAEKSVCVTETCPAASRSVCICFVVS